jgi:hypothetical protein
MPTNFPASVDVLTNPVSNDSLNSPSHSLQHTNANDAIEAVEDYLLNGAGRAGLVLIKTQTIGTTVSSVTVTDAFNATYDNYRIIVSGGSGSSAAFSRLTLGATATQYYAGYNGNSFTNTYQSATDNNAAFFGFAIFADNNIGISANIDLFNPFLSRRTLMNSNVITNVNSLQGQGQLADTNSYTSFTITTSAGTLTGGTIRVYGYRNA